MTASRSAQVDVGALYSIHRLGLVRLAVLLVDELPLAEDVVQDAFLGLQRHGRDLDPGAALAYLRTSVINGARSALRRRRTARRYRAEAAAAPRPDPEDETGRWLERQRTLDAVRALPARQREVLVLRYWCELSEREIASTLGVSEGTVKSTASRALDRLEMVLGDRQ